MFPATQSSGDKGGTAGAQGPPIQDRRPKPRGVLPRQVQMWLMVGIAVVILGIILLTGRPDPASPSHVPNVSGASVMPVQPDRVRSYQERLAEQEARLRRDLAEQTREPAAFEPLFLEDPAAADPIAADRRRREYESLFADNVALTRRPRDQQPAVISRGEADPASLETLTAGGLFGSALLPPDVLALQQALAEARPALASAGEPPSRPDAAGERPALSPPTAEVSVAGQPEGAHASGTTDPIAARGPFHRLLEGTVIEAALLNRLDGSFAGPVNGLVTTAVYSHSRQHVLIPAGARVLGSASPVQGWGESRLAVRFHRLVMPDGRTHSLEQFQGLNQVGDTGLRDQVNRHYLQVFGASLAIGAISGLAQFGTRGGYDPSFGDAYRQSAGASLAASSGRVLDRYLNVRPTVTIREGHRLKIYLTNDLELPEYTQAAGRTRPPSGGR